MCRGWALGTKDFKKALTAEATEELDETSGEGGDNKAKQVKKVPRYDGGTLPEANELRWELALEQCLQALGKAPLDCKQSIKSADWKIRIAAALKKKTSATSVWIAQALHMGVSNAVSRYVGLFNQSGANQTDEFRDLIANITT